MLLALAIVVAGALGESAVTPGWCVTRPWDGTAFTVKNIDLFAHERAPLAQAGLRACPSWQGWASGCLVQAEACVGRSRGLGAWYRPAGASAAPRRPTRAPARPSRQDCFEAVNAESGGDRERI